jgi:hypothetical protein
MNRSIFFDRVRVQPFAGTLTQGQVEGLDRLLDEAERIGLADRGQLAYVLATSFHETARRMQPVRETLAASDAAAIRILDAAWKAGRLPWVKTAYWRPDGEGKSWLGRGDVQLTWKANYEKMSALIGIDLVADPDLALDPAVSARILFEGMLKGASGRGDFTGHALETYVAGPKRNFVGARRVVNGTDKAAAIAAHAEAFLAALDAAEWTAGAAEEPKDEAPIGAGLEVTAKGLHLRAWPVEGDVLASLMPGQTLELVSTWHQVRGVVDGAERKGWVSGDFVRAG